MSLRHYISLESKKKKKARKNVESTQKYMQCRRKKLRSVWNSSF